MKVKILLNIGKFLSMTICFLNSIFCALILKQEFQKSYLNEDNVIIVITFWVLIFFLTVYHVYYCNNALKNLEKFKEDLILYPSNWMQNINLGFRRLIGISHVLVLLLYLLISSLFVTLFYEIYEVNRIDSYFENSLGFFALYTCLPILTNRLIRFFVLLFNWIFVGFRAEKDSNVN